MLWIEKHKWRQGVLHFQIGEDACIKFNDAISWELWQFKLKMKKKKLK